MNQQQEKWSEYWAQADTEGEVFVGKDGSSHPKLAEFWTAQFAGLSAGARVVDLACGAGSVFAHLAEPTSLELHGLDTSGEALELLLQRLPSVKTQIGSVSEPGYDSHSFDLVVSQFGIEYAGVDAFAAAARLVAAGGRFAALVHLKDGHIDQKNQRLLAGAKVAQASEFADRALDLVKAGIMGDKAAQDSAADAFVPAERSLGAEVMTNRNGLHAQLYTGFRHLFEQRQHYQPQDILLWLAKSKDALDTAFIRLESMCMAALSGDQINEVKGQLEAEGLAALEIEPFATPNNSLPIAWAITATRAS